MTTDPLSLERHTAFAARLARGLVADENLADDLVQDTWLAVLRRPPRDLAGIQAYLATTLSRLAGRARRSEARRASRERDTARSESLPSSAALAQAMEQHRRVVAALLELGEPTRTAILLRYLEDLPPRAIAARTGEPVETIRTRIKRGLAALRHRLDEREGGRGTWAVTLLPLSRAPAAALASTAGGGAATIGTGILVMTLQKKLMLGAALVIAGGIAWRIGGSGAERPIVPEKVSTGGPVPEEDSDALEPSAVEADKVDGGARTALVTETREPPDPTPARVQGTILVLDGEGGEHRSETGVLVVREGGESREVPVADGRFALPRPVPDSLRIDRAELGGRPAYLERREIELADGRPPALVARWPPPSVLRVLDARTGAELDDLLVVRGVPAFRGAVHPGAWDEEQVFARGARSPLALTSFAEDESWWVHAPGYAWGWLRFDHRTGGERELSLEPGAADLVVRLAGFSTDLNLWVHVFPPHWERSTGSLAQVRHPTDGRLVLEGLPPGEVQVRAELGIWHDGPHELARAEIELLPGARNEVVLDLDESGPLPAAVPLAGRIVLPVGHPDLDLPFEVLPADGAARRKSDRLYSGSLALVRVPGEPRVRRFDAGLVTPGEYLFVASSLQCWERVRVGPSGAPDVQIVLPEIAEVRVRVVDEASGEPLALGPINWSAGQPEGVSSWTLARVEPEPDAAAYAFLAPLRPIRVTMRWNEFEAEPLTIDVGPGAQEHELRVERDPGAWIRLLDGEAVVPVEWGWKVEIAPLEGDVRARISRIERGRAWITAERPGTYVVTLPEVAGFQPVPPRTLELGPGAPTELTIELVRR